MSRRPNAHMDASPKVPRKWDYGPKYGADGRELPIVVRRPDRVLERINGREFAAFKPRFEAWKREFERR